MQQPVSHLCRSLALAREPLTTWVLALAIWCEHRTLQLEHEPITDHRHLTDVLRHERAYAKKLFDAIHGLSFGRTVEHHALTGHTSRKNGGTPMGKLGMPNETIALLDQRNFRLDATLVHFLSHASNIMVERLAQLFGASGLNGLNLDQMAAGIVFERPCFSMNIL
nr:hypothetical protein XAC3610_9230016 [Xanthomonas citri pv. citri]